MKKSLIMISAIVLLSLTSCGETKVEITGDEKKAVMSDVVDAYSKGEVTLPTSKNYGLSLNTSLDGEASLSNTLVNNISKQTTRSEKSAKLNYKVGSDLALILDGDSHSLGEKTTAEGGLEATTSTTVTPDGGEAKTDSSSLKLSGKVTSKAELSDKFYTANDINGTLTSGNTETTYKNTLALHQDEVSVDTAVSNILSRYGITDLSGYKIPSFDISDDMKTEIGAIFEGTDETFNKYFTLGLYTQGENYVISFSANKDALKADGGKDFATDEDTKDEVYAIVKSRVASGEGFTLALNSLKYTIGDSFKFDFSLTLNKDYLPLGLTYDINLNETSLVMDYNLTYTFTYQDIPLLLCDFKRTQEIKITKLVSALTAELKFGTDVKAILMTDDEKKQAAEGKTLEEFISTSAPKQ